MTSDTDHSARVMPIPFGRLLGIEVQEATDQRIRARMVVREDLCNPVGSLHGGAIMSLADTLGAMGAFRNRPDGAAGTTTLESKTNFIGGARVGDTVIGEATPVHNGRRTAVWTTRITTEAGELVAVVTQTQMVL